MKSNIEIPKQAVILAGGRGTRLRPLTDTLPKPMIKVHGKPFLEYLIEQLRDQGFERILLLLGYLPHVIQDYFGDGRSWGLKIDYSVSDIEDETGRRIKLAEHKLDPCFFLLYCDNYWPMNMTKMWKQFLDMKTNAQITVYKNVDKYSKSNLLWENTMVVHYDKSRSKENLNGVDIGYAIINKETLSLLPDTNINLESALYPALIERGLLSAYVTDHRYYSMGSHERLSLTELFLKRRPAIILDRDGVLNKKPPKGEYVRNRGEFIWLPGAQEAIRLLKAEGYTIIIVSNQAGIARGMMTESDLKDIHKRMKEELSENSTTLDAFYYCPHHWDDGCECRKPKPGMLFQAQKEFHLDLSRTFFVGDDIRDEQAANAAGCKSLLVSPDWSLLQIVKAKRHVV